MAERRQNRPDEGRYGGEKHADIHYTQDNPQRYSQNPNGYTQNRPQNPNGYAQNRPPYPNGYTQNRPPYPNGYTQNRPPYPNGGSPGYPDNKKGKPKKKRSVFGDILSGFLMIIALCVFLYSGYTLYGYYKEYKKSADEYDNLEDNFVIQNAETEDYDRLEAQQQTNDTVESETPVTEEMVTVEENGEIKTVPLMVNPVDFTELKNINEDIIGWLKIRALDISYPVVQGEDNDFYLHRTFEKKDNFAGCIFMNSENEADFTDMNTIIYGHNMKDGSMFGKLKKFEDEEVWKKSEYFWIFTPDLIYQYHIFSVRTVNKTGPTYQTFFTDEEFRSVLDTAFSQSMVENSDITVDTDDRIVTLSTCTGNDATRLVVVGKLEQVYAVKK